ncbi:MAG: putative SigmaB asociated two-component system sensor protein, partial [Labilithrix sp.]|nr:putative SigmaB asociated two-component system sensor protein [Labilithrix sp.]
MEEGLRSVRDALRAVGSGDFSVRLPTDGNDVLAEVALAFNALVERNATLVNELDRVATSVGQRGEVGDRASLGPTSGAWASAVESVNGLIESMAFPTLEATRVMDRIAAGDLSCEMPSRLDGHALDGAWRRFGSSVNTAVGCLRAVSAGVSRVAYAIGTEGRLGVQVEAAGLEGTWRRLVEDVNLLSSDLTAQVRSIALVTTAMARGDLSQKIVVDARGEILEVKNTINSAVDQLRSVAAEVIRVARVVGTDGMLGAQAGVRGVSGVWQELT